MARLTAGEYAGRFILMPRRTAVPSEIQLDGDIKGSVDRIGQDRSVAWLE